MTSAIEIKAADVQKLRLTTGAGLMDCKRALEEAKGDMEKAIRILREKGIAKSSKRADRLAAEGIVDTWISPDNKTGLILELNCETDFVARNEEFVALAKTLLTAIKDHPSWTSVEQVPQEACETLSAKVGEKISLKRFTRYSLSNGIVASYIHPGSKLAVLVQVESNKNGPVSENLKNLGKELALQIAGANPLYVTPKDVPQDVLTREKEIAKKQMEGQKKPAEVLEKIALGKLQQFYEAQCLVEQPYIRDASGKTKVQNLLDKAAQQEGAELHVVQFVRYRVGAE